jgi:hypothetical protein
MRTIQRRVWCALLVMTAAVSLSAQNSGPSSNGDFQFALEGANGSIQYNARQHGASASGEITFNGNADISGEDVDGDGSGNSGNTGVTFTVTVDCLRVQGKHAAMSGLVTSASASVYNGIRVLLAVEDGGEGKNATRDRFTWGVYRSTAQTWVPEDAEVPGDNGAFLTWIATDAERDDDVGVPSSAANGPVDCKSFPFGSYAFEEVALGGGNIQVRP